MAGDTTRENINNKIFSKQPITRADTAQTHGPPNPKYFRYCLLSTVHLYCLPSTVYCLFSTVIVYYVN